MSERYALIKKEFIYYCKNNDKKRVDVVGAFYVEMAKKYKVYPSIHTLFYWYDIYKPNKLIQ